MKIPDFLFFPVRALFVHEENRWGLTSLRYERMAYAAKETTGYTLDVGCGRHNKFIREFLGGNGKGVDAFLREGLTDDQVIKDPAHFPFPDNTFDSATFISSLNHIPRDLRLSELKETYRCLKPGGKIVVTMGTWLIKSLSYPWVAFYDWLFKSDFNWDVAGRGGMRNSEAAFLSKKTILSLLTEAGFKNRTVKRFPTQWWLHFLFTAHK